MSRRIEVFVGKALGFERKEELLAQFPELRYSIGFSELAGSSYEAFRIAVTKANRALVQDEVLLVGKFVLGPNEPNRVSNANTYYETEHGWVFSFETSE